MNSRDIFAIPKPRDPSRDKLPLNDGGFRHHATASPLVLNRAPTPIPIINHSGSDHHHQFNHTIATSSQFHIATAGSNIITRKDSSISPSPATAVPSISPQQLLYHQQQQTSGAIPAIFSIEQKRAIAAQFRQTIMLEAAKTSSIPLHVQHQTSSMIGTVIGSSPPSSPSNTMKSKHLVLNNEIKPSTSSSSLSLSDQTEIGTTVGQQKLEASTHQHQQQQQLQQLQQEQQDQQLSDDINKDNTIGSATLSTMSQQQQQQHSQNSQKFLFNWYCTFPGLCTRTDKYLERNKVHHHYSDMVVHGFRNIHSDSITDTTTVDDKTTTTTTTQLVRDMNHRKEWRSSIVIERLSQYELKSVKGSIYQLEPDSCNFERMCNRNPEVSIQFLQHFKYGIPFDWRQEIDREYCRLLHIKTGYLSGSDFEEVSSSDEGASPVQIDEAELLPSSLLSPNSSYSSLTLTPTVTTQHQLEFGRTSPLESAFSTSSTTNTAATEYTQTQFSIPDQEQQSDQEEPMINIDTDQGSDSDQDMPKEELQSKDQSNQTNTRDIVEEMLSQTYGSETDPSSDDEILGEVKQDNPKLTTEHMETSSLASPTLKPLNIHESFSTSVETDEEDILLLDAPSTSTNPAVEVVKNITHEKITKSAPKEDKYSFENDYVVLEKWKVKDNDSSDEDYVPFQASTRKKQTPAKRKKVSTTKSSRGKKPVTKRKRN